MTMSPFGTSGSYGNGAGYDQSRDNGYDDQRGSGDEQMERVRDLILEAFQEYEERAAIAS